MSIDQGITFFDTADIYGQGDSERLLARALAQRGGYVLGTKVGQRFSWKNRLARPIKKPMAFLSRHSTRIHERVATQRGHSLPRDFERTYVRAAVERSLGRLRKECLDIVYLHSPSVQEIKSGEGLEALEKLHHEGKLKLVAVACDTPDVAEECLRDRRVTVLQIPFGLHIQAFSAVLAKARARNVSVVGREIFTGVRKFNSPLTRNQINDCVQFATRSTEIEVALVGTTSIQHLGEILEAATVN